MRHKKLITILAAASILIFVCICVIGINQKSDEEKIIERVNILSESLNEGDADKMMECFSPASRSQIKALMGLGSALLGTDSDMLWEMWSLGSIQMTKGNEKLLIKIHNIEINEDNTARVEISMSCDVNERRETLKLIEIKDEWYFDENMLY